MANMSTEGIFASQWKNLNGSLSLLMIIGGPVIQSALARLTGPSLVPLCFSFGWVSYAFSTIASLVGDGRLMPAPDYSCMVINLETGYKRTNRSWIIGRLMRDLETPLDNEAMCISIYQASDPPKAVSRWHSVNSSTWWGIAVISFQLILACIPLRHGDWGILCVTVLGTIAALTTASWPQWRIEKLSRRDKSTKRIAITAGNGSRHVLIILCDGKLFDLEDLASSRSPLNRQPWERLNWFTRYIDKIGNEDKIIMNDVHAHCQARQTNNVDQNQEANPALSEAEATALYIEDKKLRQQVKLWRGLPAPYWLTRLVMSLTIITWTTVLILVLSLKQNQWWLMGIGVSGMMYTVCTASARLDLDSQGIHLNKKPTIFTGEKVQDVLMDLDVNQPGCGRALLNEFFPGGLDKPEYRGEQEWWDMKAKLDGANGRPESSEPRMRQEGSALSNDVVGRSEAGQKDDEISKDEATNTIMPDPRLPLDLNRTFYNQNRYLEKFAGRRYDAEIPEVQGTPSRGVRWNGAENPT